MANLTRIKILTTASTTTAPANLKTGEFAYSYVAGTQGNNGDRLYMGTGAENSGPGNAFASSVDVIGGKYFTQMLDHVHGTVTNNSAVIVDGKPVGQSIIQGEGAGPAATTSALVSDISSILRGNIKFPFSLSNKERKKLNFENIDDRSFSAYLRFEVLDKPGVLSNITNIFSKNKVSIKRLIQDPDKNRKSSSIIIITHNIKNY